MSTGQRLRQLREEKGLDRAEVAKDLNMPYTTYTNYETDQREPRHGTLCRFAEYFDVSVDYLLARTNIRKPNSLEDNASILVGASATVTVTEVAKQIPILGTIAAGLPLYAEQNIEDHLTIPLHWGVDYALRVKGESMIDVGIPDGSLVLCRQQDDIDDGQIAVCLVNGDEATLKRVKRYDNILVLHPENRTMSDQIFKGRDQASVRILGLAKKVVRDI